MPAIDIFVVVFLSDMRLLKMQMFSFKIFCREDDFSKYIIVINEPLSIARDLRDQIESWAADSWIYEKLRIILLDDVFPFDSSVKGWHRQQAIKLYVGYLSESSFALILDAKNHLLRVFDKSRLFDDIGRLLTTDLRVKRGDQRRWLSDSFSLLGVDNFIDFDVFRSPPTTTPYLVNLDDIRDLSIGVLGGRGTWMDFFRRSRGEETEFFLYAAWIYKKYGSFDRYFFVESARKTYSVTLFGRYPSSSDQIESFVRKLQGGSVQFMGFHRARMEHVMSLESPYPEVRLTWIHSGIFRDEDEICAFFSDKS